MTESAHFWQTISQLVHGLHTLVSIGCHIALLVVVVTVVRRHRPDAQGALLGWAILALVGAAIFPVFMMASVMIFSRQGVDAVLAVQAFNTIVSLLFTLVVSILLVRGLAKLAQPPKPVVVDGERPYR